MDHERRKPRAGRRLRRPFVYLPLERNRRGRERTRNQIVEPRILGIEQKLIDRTALIGGSFGVVAGLLMVASEIPINGYISIATGIGVNLVSIWQELDRSIHANQIYTRNIEGSVRQNLIHSPEMNLTQPIEFSSFLSQQSVDED